MNTALLEKLNIKVSRLGFGGMRLPKTSDGHIDTAKAGEMVKLAYRSGINYFDTAYMYHDGESESFLGEALSGFERSSFCLADKMPVWMCKTKDDVERIFNDQLKKCKTDYFDFYLIHAVDEHKIKKLEQFDVYGFLKQKQSEGKIKYLGFSFHDRPSVLQSYTDKYDFDFAQIQFNYFDYKVQDAKKQYDILDKKGIPCFVMEPVRGGFLSQLPEDAAQIMADEGIAMPQPEFALKWAASFKNVKVILSGMSSLEQLEENIKTFSGETMLTDAQMQAAEKIVDFLLSKKLVPCTACRYCMDCGFGVDIPEIFDIYNEYKIFGNKDFAKTRYFNWLGEKHRADKCTACGACAAACPQHIDIPNRLAEIAKQFAKLQQ